MTAREVLLDGGSPWGFRMNGGADVGHALRISRVNHGSKAAQRGVREGDVITSINGQPTKCLTNGDSHALLRTVGDTLLLGLNQDTSGSPKRRSKEPVKREASSSSTQSTPSTPVSVDATPTAAPGASSPPDTTPSDQSEPSSAGAKVFVCGIWNSVNKPKHRGKEVKNGGKDGETVQERVQDTSPEVVKKASSSKARRLRKLKLKSVKREEQSAAVDQSPEVQDVECSDNVRVDDGRRTSVEVEDDKVELVVIMDEEDVRKAGGVVLENEEYFSEYISESMEQSAGVVGVMETRASIADKTKTKKKNNKSKGFSLSQIFTSKIEKSQNYSSDSKVDSKPNIESSPSNDTIEIFKREEIVPQKSIRIIPAAVSETTNDIIKEILIEKNANSERFTPLDDPDSSSNQDILPELKVKSNPVLNSSTTFTVVENETILEQPTKIESTIEKLTSSALKISKIVMMSTSELKTTADIRTKFVNENQSKLNTVEEVNISENNNISDKSMVLKKTEEEGSSRPISIFVVPPDNVAEEAEAADFDWESVSDFETKSKLTSSDDDVRPETMVHLPCNDLQTSAVVKDGRNGIVHVDDYELSVQDLSSPLIAPEEEARLRCFLETLNLTKPEEFDDTSSSKSYGDSSSTSMSESSPIPPPASDEIVVYRHVKSHSVAEPCYIPPRHQRHLDVINEETSDPSDSERKNGSSKPWENPELIRQINEVDEIPNDWYSSEEPGTTSDEGGIDTSWRDGKKLEEVEGVEVVYLSDDSDDEESVSKSFEGNITDLRNKENLPELVVVHAIDRQDVKSTVKIQKPTEQKETFTLNESNYKKHAMDEIVAILDSTYEINKDLFMKQSSNENRDKSVLLSKPSPNSVRVNEGPDKTKLKLNSETMSEFKNIIEDPMSIYKTTFEPASILDDFDSGKYDSHNNSVERSPFEISLDEIPVAQEVLLAMTPPTLSRQGSSSSATSQSTAKYNPGHSPLSSETEDKADNESRRKEKSGNRLYNPKSLTSLSKYVITNLPHGEFYLKKIGFSSFDAQENEGFEENTEKTTHGKLASLPPSGITTRGSSVHELENIYSQKHYSSYADRETSPPRPVLLKSPPPSSLTSPPPNDEPWVGLPTSADHRLLVCLSPSQSKNTTMTTPQEATELLELHKKFGERRGYHETSKRNSICSPRSRTPDFNSPDLIRLEPYESKRAQVYTPELLIEAANLLALKEYRQSRFRSGAQSNGVKTQETTGVVKINSCVLEENSGLSGVTSRTEIDVDSEGPDSNRSAGTSRLLALIQDSGVPCSSPSSTAPSEMDRVDNSGVRKTDSVLRYSGSYISEWLTMSENVTSKSASSKTDVNKNVIDLKTGVDNGVATANVNSNDKNDGLIERRQFEADKYKISKQGDIAIIQTADDGDRNSRNERPKSLPAVGVPALNPSGGEVFREQMYHEYMNRVAERTERRHQKVIKISSRPTSMYSKTEPEVEKSQIPAANKLETEFMMKARERMSKLGINLDDEPREEEAEEVPEADLPKHLQEFIELTTAPQADVTQDTPTDGNTHTVKCKAKIETKGLLKEIDQSLTLGRGFLTKKGVWSPGATPEAQRKEFNFSTVKEEVVQEDTDPVPPVWTPKSAQSSPTAERKAFRPVSFESPKLSRKTYNQQTVCTEEVPKPPTDLPLALDSPSHSQASSLSSSSQYVSTTRETVTSSSQSLPRAQNPTITLLQKAREGQLPRGAHYLDLNSNNTAEVNSSPPAVRPNDILYSIRREYESESEEKRPKKIADLGPRKYDGIGPTTKEGIPIVLRSEVQDENQQKWYKRMYDSLHRAERDKEYVTVRYKSRRGRYPYTSQAGYLSEPERLGGYDSDYTTAKYATLDRRRIRNKENDFTTSTMPRSKYNAVKHAVDVYKNQPGRIEDYEPGHSSIAEKETKQWWDEVMDIFDGQFEQTQKSSPRTQAPATTSTSKPFMTYALKESGYESDSTLVFKRRDETQQLLSPAEQKLAYKVIQKGGDVPLHGLRKHVPDKPKGPDDSELEYFPISPHLTRIRIHKTKQVIKPMKEVICYPITSIQVDKPPPVFASYKRTAKTSSNLIPTTEASSSRPPSPPKRRSSHNSSTLRLYSRMSISPSPKKSRLGRSSSGGIEVDSNVQYLKDRITSKLGVGMDSSTSKEKKDRITSSTSLGKTNRYVLRTGSLSPSLHTKVTTSPSGTTKSIRKTSLERKTSLRSRKDQMTTTRLTKSAELRAPAEVKKVLKQCEVKERSSSSKSFPPGTVVKSSTTLYSSSRGSKKPKEDKQLKVTVAISAKGRELLRSSSVSSTSGLKDVSLISTNIETTATTTTTTTSTTTTAQPVFSSSPTVFKSVSSRPSSRSDSDKRPSSRSTNRDSPVEREIKSPVNKTTTLSTFTVSPVPSNDLLKTTKKPEVTSVLPKKKKEKTGTSKAVSLVKSVTKRNGKDNDSESNSKKKSKKSKDGDSPPSSKRLTKKNGTKKSREKVEQKKIGENGLVNGIVCTGENKENLAMAPIRRMPTPDFSDSFKGTPPKAFFQNLLMRNLPSPSPSKISTLQRTSSVLERAKKFHMSDGHSSLPYRSEPSLRLINVYLSNKKPVSESKFRSLDREVTSNRSSRSQSPLCGRGRRYEFLEKIDKFDRINNVWDKGGYYSPIDLRSRSPELFKERSSSEPPRASPTNESDHQDKETFGNIDNAHWDYDNMSPTHSRSPSCRRIRSARTVMKTIESIGGLKRKGMRAKSLSEADAKRSFPPTQAQSTSSLNLSHLTDHSDYQTYVMELLHSTKKSDRFKELHKFYASLERMGELERTTSNTDLRPRKKGEEVIDYDRWKQLRTKERAEEELKHLYEKLKEDQKEKDLLFQPRDCQTIKWKGDRGLRSKEKSVEDLCQRFQRMAYEDSDIEVGKRRAIDANKDVYKPLWRGSSVMNLANTLTSRTRRGRSVSEVDQTAASIPRPMGSRISHSIGSRLWSSLSMEQVNALKNQLSEIYNTVSSLKRDRINRMLQAKSCKDYEIVIPSKENYKTEPTEPLHVRCNSLLSKDQLYSPLNKRKEAQRIECKKADSISSIPNWRGSNGSNSGSGESSNSHSPLPKPLSEKEKKKLSMTLSQEVKNRVSKKYSEERKKKRHVSSSIVIPRETRGAVAAIKGTKKTARMKSPSHSDSSPRTCYSLEMSEEGSIYRQTSSTSSHTQDKGDFLLVLTPKDDDTQEVKKVVDEWAENKTRRPSREERVVARLVQTTSNSETDSGSSEASTVIHLGSREDVQKKVNYFETKKNDRKEIDGRVSRSAGDVRPFSQEIKQRAKSAPSTFNNNKLKSNLASSQSYSDLKELFGEKRASLYATTPLRKVTESKNIDFDVRKSPEKQYQAVDSGLQSSEESLPIRSRSVSPDPMKYYRAYLNMVKAGDVRKLREKFESLDDLYTIADEENLREPSPPPKRYQSDPELTKEFFARKGTDVGKTIVRGQEVGDVKWLKKRYEFEPERGRTKTRRVVSPVPLKSDNRFMPHINVISKLASLQQKRSLTAPARPDPCIFRTGEVDRLRQQFEAQQQELSLLGQMFTSTPDIHELRDIAPYLECNWVAHQYPKPRSLSSPETQRSMTYSPKPRPASSSPVRRQTASILKPQQKKQRDIFANQHFDPSIHRPLYRYQPPSPCVDTSYHYRPWTKDPNWWWRHLYPSTKPTVTFKGAKISLF